MMEGEQQTGEEVAFTAKSEPQPAVGERSVLHPYNWQEELTYFLTRNGDAPGGQEFPDYMAFRIVNALEGAKREGDTRAEQDLNRLEDAYVFSAFPFLSDALQSSYAHSYYDSGWLTPQEREDHQVIALNDELYHYHTRLLEKANIPELYRLTGQGEVPHRLTKKTGSYAVPIQPVLTQTRQIVEEKGIDWKQSPPSAK